MARAAPKSPSKRPPRPSPRGVVIQLPTAPEPQPREDERAALVDAAYRAHAVVEYRPDGTVTAANDKFLALLGYQPDELVGQPKRLFCETQGSHAESYQRRWEQMKAGDHLTAEQKLLGKGGHVVWVRSDAYGIAGQDGQLERVVSTVVDITAYKLRAAEYSAQLSALHHSQAVIELSLDGTVLDANENFLAMVDYSLDEIKGKNHKMFVDAQAARSAEYALFWAHLAAGRFQQAEYRRIAKGGKEIWIQASYNPIFDLDGKPYKIVKLATETTARRIAEEHLRHRVDELLRTVAAAAGGDLTVPVTVSGEDAIGKIGEAVKTLLETIKKSVAAIAGSAGSVAAASDQLATVSEHMSVNAENTNTQAGVASQASAQVNKNVQLVSTGTEEMSASIREIARNSSDAVRVASQAVKVAETTNALVGKLGESSADIGKVIKVITSIAQQTNLLALNATIEAARAGEAGKGFAVVANAVKELAKETGKATDDISQKVEAIQTDTRSAVSAIGEISRIISQINDLQHAIAGAVEEQTATTLEIGRSVADAAKGSSEIAQSIALVATAAHNTSAGSRVSERSVGELARTAAVLQRLVSQFKV